MNAADQARMDAIRATINREYATLSKFSAVMNVITPFAIIGIILTFRF